jgi:hypothetical protein
MSGAAAPDYYVNQPIEPIDAIWSALGVKGFREHCRGCVLKYVSRTGKKDEENPLKDDSKAIVYGMWLWACDAGHLDVIKPSEWLARARETAKGYPWEEVFR